MSGKSFYKRDSTQHNRTSAPEQAANEEAPAEEMPPEVAIAEDFKRLLAALAPEKRKELGKEFAFVFENPDDGKTNTRNLRRGGEQERKARAEKEAIEKLRAEVQKQEDHIQNLRQQISEIDKTALHSIIAAADKELAEKLKRNVTGDFGGDQNDMSLAGKFSKVLN